MRVTVHAAADGSWATLTTAQIALAAKEQNNNNIGEEKLKRREFYSLKGISYKEIKRSETNKWVEYDGI